MKKKVLAALFLALGILTGCANENSPVIVDPVPLGTSVPHSSTAGPSATATPAPTEAPTDVPASGKLAGGENHPITVRNVVDGKMQSYLTGEWKDEAVVKRRNMAVMINNIQVSLPQYGISAASIIYEAPVEGRITRLMGLFEDYDDLDHIGSVRSARDYYLYEAMAYDSIYCNWGLARPWVEELINSDRIDNISMPLAGINNGVQEAYDRIDRGSKYAKEHTGYLFIKGYNSGVKRLGYETEYRDTFVKAFNFADDGYIATYENYPSATMIFPGGTQSNAGGYGKHNPCFAYNADDGLYYRTQYGSAQVDEMNNQQLAVTNVIFKVCHGEKKIPDDPSKDYLGFGVHGTGDAYVFTNGKVIKGTWKRESDTSPNLFYDENGKEIVLNQGKTWICCIWKEYSQYMSWE